MRPAATLTPSGARSTTLALLILLVGAAATIAAPAPTLVRSLFALPALVLLTGHSAAGLVLGPALAAEHGTDKPHQLLRLLLTPVLGAVGLLASALLLEACAIELTARALLSVLTALALALMLCTRRHTVRPSRCTPRIPARPLLDGPRLGAIVVTACSVLVLAATTAGAVALQPGRGDRYLLLDLERPADSTPGPLSARAGGDVVLNWTVNSYGFALPDADPAVTISVGGSRPAQTTVQASAPMPMADPDTEATSRQSGVVAFTAPRRPGVYQVELGVAPRPVQPAASGSTLRLVMEVQP